MNQQSKYMKEIEDKYAALNIAEEEESGVKYEEELEETNDIDTRWSLVGRLLVDILIDFNAMQNTLDGLWKPGKGLYVKELGPNLYLFQFCHELDIKRVIEGSPWTFNRALLVFERLQVGINPKDIQLNHIDIWVQIHDLQAGFRSERVIKDIGNYIGGFVMNDMNNFSGAWRDFYRVRARININEPLKRKMKLKKKGGEWVWVNFKYEHAPTFCFICGIIGHSEHFCPKLFEQDVDIAERPYGAWLRAAPKRASLNFGSKWLRQEPVMSKKPEKGVDSDMQVAEDGDNSEQQSGTQIGGSGKKSGEISGICSARENFENSNVTTFMQLDGNIVTKNDTVVSHLEENQGSHEELLIIDPKRRRTDLGNKENNNENGLDCEVDGLSKNGYVAGSGVQARLEP